MTASKPLFFLEERVLKLLEEEKITLTEEQKKVYIPQFVQIIEEHLGSELIKKLHDAEMDEFGKLFSNPETTGDAWLAFWNEKISHFGDVVESSVHACEVKIKEALQNN